MEAVQFDSRLPLLKALHFVLVVLQPAGVAEVAGLVGVVPRGVQAPGTAIYRLYWSPRGQGDVSPVVFHSTPYRHIHRNPGHYSTAQI